MLNVIFHYLNLRIVGNMMPYVVLDGNPLDEVFLDGNLLDELPFDKKPTC